MISEIPSSRNIKAVLKAIGIKSLLKLANIKSFVIQPEIANTAKDTVVEAEMFIKIPALLLPTLFFLPIFVPSSKVRSPL